MVQAQCAARLVQIGSAAEYGRTEEGVPVAESAAVVLYLAEGAARVTGKGEWHFTG